MALTDTQQKIIDEEKKRKKAAQQKAASSNSSVGAGSLKLGTAASQLSPLELAKRDGATKTTVRNKVTNAKQSKASINTKQSIQNNQKKQEDRTAARNKLALSEADRNLPALSQKGVLDAKLSWEEANKVGDRAGMDKAHRDAEMIRFRHGYSGGIAGDEYIQGPDLTQKDRITLNYPGQQALLSALNLGDKGRAEEIRKAKGFQAADHSKQTDAHGRTLFTQSEEERKKAGEQFQAGAEAAGKGAVGSLLSVHETANQAMRNYNRDRWGRNLQANANQTKDKALAEASRKVLEGADIVDPMLPGQRLLRESREAQGEALEGKTGLSALLTKAGISGAQMIPGIAASFIPGVGPAVGAGLLGAQAAGAKMGELNEQSSDARMLSYMLGGDPKDYGEVTPGETFTRGIISGGIDGIIDRLMPIRNLLKIVKGAGGASALAAIAKQSGTEATEESISYLLNYAADRLAQDPNAQLSVNDLLESAAIGAISGGGFGAGAVALPTAMNRKQGQKTQTARTAQDILLEAAGFKPSQAPQEALELMYDAREENTQAQKKSPAQKRAETQSVNENGLIALSEKERQNLSSGKKNKVISTMEEVVAFVRNALTNRQNNDRAYMGKISNETADRIQAETGMKIHQYNAVLQSDNVRHIIKRHGQASGGGKGQVPVTEQDIALIPQVLASPDKVSLSGSKDSRGRPVLVFEKEIGNNYVTLQAVTDGNHSIQTDTLFIQEKKNPQDTEYYNVDVSADPAHNVQNVPPQGSSVHADDGTQAPNAIGPGNTPDASLASSSSADPIIAENVDHDNPLPEGMGAASSGFDPYSKLINEHGALDPGENPARVVDVPKQTGEDQLVSHTVQTVLEAEATPDEMVATIGELAEKGEFSYEVAGDQVAIETAEATIRDKGFWAALMDWSASVSSGVVTKQNTATGWALYNAAAQAKDAKTAADILTRMVVHQRNAAQAVQATRILKKMSPSAQLYGIQRSVQNMQEELTAKYGDKAPDLKIPDNLVENYLNAETQEARQKAEWEIYVSIGKQMPSNFRDKWNAWRYLAMLFNLRTHVRNTLGNGLFSIPVAVKNVVGTGIEAGVSALTGGKLQRTKGLFGPELASAAWGDYKNAKVQIMSGTKWEDFFSKKDAIEEGRRIFRTSFLEWLRRANSGALQVEDGWACRPHYANALAQYCAANGITAQQLRTGEGVSKAAMDKARGYAIKEAQKATFRDFNEFSDFISGLGRYSGESKVRKAASLLTEGLFPFRKTPANILVRAVEYSPIGLANSIGEMAYNTVLTAKGKKADRFQGAKVIDDLAAGLTGTGLFALGGYLASQGLLVASGDDDKEQAEFDELLGRQNYAIEGKGGTNFTIDWLAPEAIPIIMGAEFFYSRREEDGGFLFTEFLNSLSKVTNPLLEMSCLSSLNDTLDGLSAFTEGDAASLVTVLANVAIDYLAQGVPTLLGQGERTSQPERMTTYADRNLDLPTDWQYTIGKISSRIPGWDYNQIPYIDTWGRTEENSNTLLRAMNNFVNPAYTDKYAISRMEAELQRLYGATGVGVYPDRADRYFNKDGVRTDLSAGQYVTYAKAKGQKSYDLVQKITTSSWYAGAEDAVKAEVIINAYQVANEEAKKTVFPDYVSQNNTYLKAAQAQEEEGISAGDYLYLRAITGDVESLKYAEGDKAGETIDNSKGYQIADIVYQSGVDLTESQRQLIYEFFGVGKTVRRAGPDEVKRNLAEMRSLAETG